MTVSTPTALLAAAPTLVRKGIIATLHERWPQLRLTLTADATQVAELVAHIPFGLLVLDEALPGRALPGLLHQVHHARPSQRLVVLTDAPVPARPDEESTAFGKPLRLSRHIQPHTLAAALAFWLDAPEAAPATRSGDAYTVPEPFSPRELEVLRLVVDDCCNEEIANRLFINVRTVETHRRHLLQKAGTRTVVGLTARAVREGWVA